jgi:hypothetical protein
MVVDALVEAIGLKTRSLRGRDEWDEAQVLFLLLLYFCHHQLPSSSHQSSDWSVWIVMITWIEVAWHNTLFIYLF